MPDPILVTGATGNVGSSVVQRLLQSGCAVRALVTDPAAVARATTPASRALLEIARFDFGDPATFATAFAGATRLFLMRPPAIGDASVITAAVDAARALGVTRISFLSIQGAEQNPLVPHHAIEQELKRQAHEYPSFTFTMMRAAFFMQNLSTAHAADIREHDEILVPAGDGRTAFVDARDVGTAVAISLASANVHAYANRAFELTGSEALTYNDVAAVLSHVLGRTISYRHPGALRFYRAMRTRGYSRTFVGVMIALYTSARLGLADHLSPDLTTILGRAPTRLSEFAAQVADVWSVAAT